MTLRRATQSDASSLAAIAIEVWIGTYLKKGVSAFFADYALETFTPAKMRALLRDPGQFILVSENDEGIDGFIRVSRASPAPVLGCSDVEIATFTCSRAITARGSESACWLQRWSIAPRWAPVRSG